MNTALGNFIKQSPTYTGEWMPIFFEPIPLSGERVTICIAATGHDNNHKVAQTISATQMKCLYGSSWQNINGIITWILDSIRLHLLNTGSLTNWNPGTVGVYTGKITSSRSSNIEGIVNQGIRMVASLATIIDSDDAEEPVVQEKFYSAVRNALLDINSNYKDCVNKKIMLNDTRERYYGFASKNYIANYSAIASYGSSLNTALVRIMDLEDLALDNFYNCEALNMIVSPPIGFIDNALINDHVKRAQADLMQQAKSEALKRKICCEIIETPQKVAEYLHKKAA